MAFINEEPKNLFLGDTKIENIFISEYIANAPGDYVKVFLVASMCASINKNYSLQEIGKVLNILEDDVKKALIFWEEKGVIKKKGSENIIISLKDKVFPSKNEEKQLENTNQKVVSLLENKNIENMYQLIEKSIKRPLTGTEVSEIIRWVDEFYATPEVIGFAYAYGKEKSKDNVRYIGKIVKDWATKGYKTVNEVEEHLKEVEQRFYVYNRIFKALGFFRNPTEEEKKMMDNWLDEDDLSIDEILEVCKKTTGISNPNLNYINKIIENSGKGNKKKSQNSDNLTWKEIETFYKEIRKAAEQQAEKKQEEVYEKYPEIFEIDENIKEIGMLMAKEMVTGDHTKLNKIKNFEEKLAKSRKKREQLLTKNNIPVDYDIIRYNCNECNDTGIKDSGGKCVCYIEKMKGV